MCGEHFSTPSRIPTAPGSSPRVRGTSEQHGEDEQGLRLIPACAGNIRQTKVERRATSAHPRVCGEHVSDHSRFAVCLGSSPRVRGTSRERQKERHQRRLIPACAGNIPGQRQSEHISTAHPRVCGEHLVGSASWSSRYGSSPRVRGTWLGYWLAWGLARLIPACAGNMAWAWSWAWDGAAHPRVCGEHIRVISNLRDQVGSSPRVRGTSKPSPPSRQAATKSLRLIPACAGNMSWVVSPEYLQPAHPRVCGEHSSFCSRASHQTGSSPRVRGTSPSGCGSGQIPRLIPACAGNIGLAGLAAW